VDLRRQGRVALAGHQPQAPISPRCGYEHTVHVAAPNAPSVSVLPAAPRIVALSDIHGQYGLLVRLLRAHQVIDAQDRWALGKDTLVIAGDVFDRGPQVTEAFWLLYGLQQQPPPPVAQCTSC
jgi:fructose-1,6-bisphosphatase